MTVNSDQAKFEDEGLSPIDNSCAILTPPGRGAVAVIAVFGFSAAVMIDGLFESASKASLVKPNDQTIFYGRWTETGEDVVVVRTGEGRLEIHCHGGESAPLSIMDSLERNGFQVLETAEAARLLHGGGWKSEITIAMSSALTEKTANLLLHQYAIADEQISELGRSLQTNPQVAIGMLEQIIGWAEFGSHLTRPWSVVFCGHPNVGKSSLMNEIAGFHRAIVHEKPGTTRDVVSHITAIDGWPVEIKDTAGLRSSMDPIESLGIVMTQDEIKQADLVVAVFAATEVWNDVDVILLETHKPAVVVINKIDLVAARETLPDFDTLSCCSFAVLKTSATTGAGKAELIQEIAVQLIRELPPVDQLIPINATQMTILQEVWDLAQAGEISRAIEYLLRQND